MRFFEVVVVIVATKTKKSILTNKDGPRGVAVSLKSP
jgi:hypothetical protein